MTIENNPDLVGSVAAWQNILNGCGYPLLHITGNLDSATVETTKKFQNDVGLHQTGQVDRETWKAGLAHAKLEGWDPNTPAIEIQFVTKAQAFHVFGSISDRQLADLNAALKRFSIDTPPRIRHFLAQVAHESGALQFVTELWGPTADQREYEGRKDLGNNQPGDGFKFRGGGAIQLTGRYNYQQFANFIGDQKVVEQGASYVGDNYPFTSAGFWWNNNPSKENNINSYVDDGASVDKIGSLVNGKFLPNGADSRREYFALASEVIV